MANLIKWAKDRATNVGHVAQAAERQLNPWDGGATAGNPTPQPQQHAPNTFTNNPVTRGFSRTVDQINPLDSGRTWQSPHAAHPTGDSIIHQITHNGATNLLGDLLVKPFVVNPAQNVIETGRMAAADVTGNVAAQNASKVREWQNLKSSIPGFFGQQAWNTGDVVRRFPKAVMTDVHGFQGKAPTPDEQANLDAAAHSFQNTPMGMVARPFEKIADKTIPGVGADLQKAGGYDPNAGWFKTAVIDPAQGVLTAEGMKAGGKAIFNKSAPVAASAASAVADRMNVAANHPAVQALNDHLATLNKANDNMTAMGLGENHPSRIANAKAYADAVNLRNQTMQEINQGGYVKVPGGKNDPIPPELKPHIKNIEESDSGQPAIRMQFPISKLGFKEQPAKSLWGVTHKPGGFELPKDLPVQISYDSATGKYHLEDGANRVSQAMADGTKTIDAHVEVLNSKDNFNSHLNFPKNNREEEGFIKIPGGKPKDSRVPLPQDMANPGKPSRFTQGATRSAEVSPQLKTKLKDNPPNYDPVHNADQLAASEQFIKKNSLTKAVNDVQGRLNAKNGTIDNQTVADTIATIKKLDSKGGEGNWQQASDLTNHLSEHLTAAGQTVQAARLLSNRTPEGMLYGARKVLNKAGVEITPALDSALKAKIEEIKAAKPGEEKQYKIAELKQIVDKEIPSSWAEKGVSLWKAGLLTGLKTQTGNILSNLTNIGLKTASNPIAAGIDQGLTVFGKTELGKRMGLQGERTKTFTTRGDLTGAVEGVQKGWRSLKTGIDERQLEHIKFDTKQVNFGKSIAGRAAQRYVDTVFGLMGAADRPYYYSQLRNTLHDLAKADAINKGLKGAQREAHIQEFIKNPPTEAFQTATNAAEKSIFANDTTLSRIAGGVRQSVADRPLASAAVNVVMPFTKVPSAVITRMVDYTPVGAVKTLSKAIKDVKKTGVLDQRALSEGLAEAGTGTGAIFIGHQLAQNGLMTGNYPKDPKEQELWKLEGKQPNAIKVGGKWLSMNYASPAGQLMQTGAQIHEAQKNGQGGGDLLGTAAAGTGKTILNQSFLQGVQGPLDALNDPERSMSKYTKQQAGSLVPTIVGDVAKATDPYQRQSNSATDAIKAKIPKVNKDLLPKQDAFGRPLPRASSSINTMANPFRPTDVKKDTPLTSELQRLQDAGLGVMPDTSKKPIIIGSGKDQVTIKLTPQQLFDKNNKVGGQVLDAWNKIISDPGYSKLSDEDKQKALSNSLSDINAVNKADFIAKNRQDLFGQVKLNKDQKKIIQNGSPDAANYISATGSTGLLKDLPKNISWDSKTTLSKYDTMSTDERKKAFNTDKAAEYQLANAQYEKDDLNGTMTTAEKIRRKNEVDKLRVGSAYDKNVRDIHSLGKQDVYDLVTSDPNGQAIQDQLLAYDDALTKAGVQTKNKFRDKYGNIAIAPKTSGSSGSGKGRKASSRLGIFRAPKSGGGATVSTAAFRKLMGGTIVHEKSAPAPKFAQTKARKAVTVKV